MNRRQQSIPADFRLILLAKFASEAEVPRREEEIGREVMAGEMTVTECAVTTAKVVETASAMRIETVVEMGFESYDRPSGT